MPIRKRQAYLKSAHCKHILKRLQTYIEKKTAIMKFSQIICNQKLKTHLRYLPSKDCLSHALIFKKGMDAFFYAIAHAQHKNLL